MIQKISLSYIIEAIFVLILVLSISICFFSIKRQEAKTIDVIVQEKISIAQVINEVVLSPFTAIEEDFVDRVGRSFVNELTNSADMRFVAIIDSDGEVVLNNRADVQFLLSNIDNSIQEALMFRRTISRDMAYGGEDIKTIIYPGYDNNVVIIGTSIAGIQEDTKMWTTIILGTSAMLLILMLVFIYLILDYLIITPIKKISQGYIAVGEGDLNTSIDPGGPSEIKHLGDSFNQMMENIKDYQIQLEQSNDILEEKVAQRTKDLAKLNDSLEGKIQERTADLEKNVEELERFHKLTTGRELRMIELKKEIEDLKKKLKDNKKTL
ncbi:MAG: HAMP domain-containing protein [Candidatus Pacebacteria bacterium]|nr:HAMP domain-containing protein [Candidatus Paceibacterota bacterium]